MPEDVIIPISLLRQATNVLLSHLESVAGDGVAVGHDYFWSVPFDEMFEFESQPSALMVGQLTDCIGNLEQILDDPSGATSLALIWLADLMRVAGVTVVQ